MNEEYIRSLADLMVIKGRPRGVAEGNFVISNISHLGFEECGLASIDHGMMNLRGEEEFKHNGTRMLDGKFLSVKVVTCNKIYKNGTYICPLVSPTVGLLFCEEASPITLDPR